jgi:hypothetical protein
MSKLAIKSRYATPDDAAWLAPLLRQQDQDELRAAHGDADPVTLVRDGIARSTEAWTVTVTGDLAMVLGVAPYTLLGDQGVVWMLGTDVAPRFRHALMRKAPIYIARMLDLYPVLFNCVHAKNTASIRWLKRLGFALGEPVALTTGESFIPFSLRR